MNTEPSLAAQGRPSGVLALALVEVLTGAVFLLGGTALLTFTGGGSSALYAFGTVHLPIGFSFLALGGLSLIPVRRWVWVLSVAVAVVSIFDDLTAFVVVQLPYDGQIGTVVVLITAVVVLYLLVRPDVRAYFGFRN